MTMMCVVFSGYYNKVACIIFLVFFMKICLFFAYDYEIYFIHL